MRAQSEALAELRARVGRWMQDGRADRVLAAYAREEASFEGDAYLLLQYGDALGQHDRLADAQRSYERASALPGASAAQKDFARARLDWIEGEWQRIEEVRGSLARAWMLGGLGVAAVGACGAVLWICARRGRLAGAQGDA